MMGDDQVWKDQQLQRALDLRGGGHPIGEAVKAALDAGANPNMLTNSHGSRSPLALAVKWGAADAAAHLLRAGADPDEVGIPGSAYYGITPRRTAASMARDMESQSPAESASPFSLRAAQVFEIAGMLAGTPKSSETLAREREAQRKTYQDRSLFLALAWHPGVDVIAALVDAGASVHARNSSGKTPLLLALCRGDAEQARKLLDLGSDPRAEDSNGNTATIHAATVRGAECLRLALTAGADLQATNKDGRTPLMVAAINGNDAATRLLIDAGAELSAVDKHGLSASDYARDRATGHGETACLTAIGEALRAREERAALLSATEDSKALGRDGRPAREGSKPRSL